MSTFQLAAGDAFPVVFGLRDARGAAITPPDGATAAFRMVGRSTRTVVTGEAEIEGDEVTWTPAPEDTEVADLYDAQITVTYPGDEVRRFPSKVGAAALSGLVIEVCATP